MSILAGHRITYGRLLPQPNKWRTALVVWLLSFIVLQCVFETPLPVLAVDEGISRGTVSGKVVTADDKPIANARVFLAGPVKQVTFTDTDGAWTLFSIPFGLYSLHISKDGYSDIDIRALSVTSSETSVRTILAAETTQTGAPNKVLGRVVVRGSSKFNPTAASVSVVTSENIRDQGKTAVEQVLDQEPGVSLSRPESSISNGAVPGSGNEYPQVRGGAPYETATYIDGHAVFGRGGGFDVSHLMASSLESIDVIKGPGAASPSINYAIGGTVNFRPLEPTLTPTGLLEQGFDSFGGSYTDISFRGTVSQNRLGYAGDYYVQGSPTALTGTKTFVALGPGFTINGQPITGNGFCTAPGPGCQAWSNPNPGLSFSPSTNFAAVACCNTVDASYTTRSESGRLRYRLTPTTTVTATFIGAHDVRAYFQTYGYVQPATFQPGTGYTGVVPSGSNFQAATTVANPSSEWSNQQYTGLDLYQQLKVGSLALRFGAINETVGLNCCGGSPTNIPTGSMNVYGTVYTGSGPSPTTYNGTAATLSVDGFLLNETTHSAERDTTLEYDVTAPNDNAYSVSLDRFSFWSFQHSAFAFFGMSFPSMTEDGTHQATYALRSSANIGIARKVRGILSAYSNLYQYHALDSSGNFTDFGYGYTAPRLGITWSPTSNASWRFATGGSIAPPYPFLLAGAAFGPFPDNFSTPTFYYIQNFSGLVKPETAFGYDLGADFADTDRVSNFSFDLYETTLHGQFFQSTALDGKYLGLPLYLQQYANLAHSRYHGLEVDYSKSPRVGIGVVLQGALTRAYAYDIPQSIYNGPFGPDTANLTLLPNVNFNGQIGQVGGAIPYSQGFAEVDYRSQRGMLIGLSGTYIGPNNNYNLPAFVELGANLRIPVANRLSFQVAVDNLTNQYNGKFFVVNDPNSILVPQIVGGSLIQGHNVLGPRTTRFSLQERF